MENSDGKLLEFDMSTYGIMDIIKFFPNAIESLELKTQIFNLEIFE